MTFTDSIRTCFSKYITFSGRASRSEYWWFILFIFLGHVVTGILDTTLLGWDGTTTELSSGDGSYSAEASYEAGPIGTVFGLATLLPLVAAGWRRMHDTGRPGYLFLYPSLVMIGILVWLALYGAGGIIGGPLLIISLIVLIISPFLVLWWLTRPSQPKENEFGPVPISSLSGEQP